MDINKYVQDVILHAVEACAYDKASLLAGIDAYIKANGFAQLSGQFSDEVIKKTASSILNSVMPAKPEEVVLYFSNYELIERVRLLNNQSLKLARQKLDGKEAVNTTELNRIEEKLDEYMRQINGIDGLYEFLNLQISEIVLNMDYAKGRAPYAGQRLASEGMRAGGLT